MRFRPWLVFIVVLPMMTAHAQGRTDRDVPFKLKQGHFIVLEGTLGELTGRNFVLDTGVAPTMIDAGIAATLGLSGERPHPIHAVMYDIDTIEMSLSNMTMGPIRVERLPVVATDLTGLSKKIGVRVDALVGLDVLGRRSFTINYLDNTIRFDTPAPSSNHAALVQEKYMVTVEMLVGHTPLHMLVDTGAAEMILFRNRIDIVSPASEIQHNKSNLGGKLLLTRVPAPTLRLGPAALDVAWAFLVDDPHVPVTIDGLLGVSPQFFDWIAFDFERRLLSWQVRDPRIPPITEIGIRTLSICRGLRVHVLGPGGCFPGHQSVRHFKRGKAASQLKASNRAKKQAALGGAARLAKSSGEEGRKTYMDDGGLVGAGAVFAGASAGVVAPAAVFVIK